MKEEEEEKLIYGVCVPVVIIHTWNEKWLELNIYFAMASRRHKHTHLHMLAKIM